MILTRQDLTAKGKHEFTEEVVIPQDKIKDNPILVSVNELNADVETDYIDKLNIIHTTLSGVLTLRSTRTLKPLEYELELEDEMILCFDKEIFDPDSMRMFEGDELDLNEYFYSLLISSIPLQIYGDDEEGSVSGDNYEIITEDEYYSRKNEEINPAFAALQDLDLDEDK